MRKRRLALSTLLILCVAVSMILGTMPISVLAADAAEPALTGTKLTTAHAGQTLTAGEYYVEPGTTLTLKGGTGKSGLTVAANSTVTIHIPANSTLNVYGGAASGTTGAGAGIEVGSTSNLKIIGSGTLNAYGGKGANGSDGARGESADWVDDGYSYVPDSGYGGAGGGGAGAGIGTKGGKGGARTNWTLAMSGRYYRSEWTDNFKNKNVSGSDGQDGNNGATADACGGIYVQPGVTVNATGGAAGTAGGGGGSMGSKDEESDDGWMRGLAGGSGGGGGGSGKKGADIGTGGGGGGSGGAGGGIGYIWSYRTLGAGGGGGGAGAVAGAGGVRSAWQELSDCKKWGYFGGLEKNPYYGSSGGYNVGGEGGRGTKVKIRDWKDDYWEWPYAGNGGKGGDAGRDCQETEYQTLYTVSINDGDGTTVYYASADKFLPATLAVQNQTGYTFQGYYGANDTQYYDENGNRTSAKITDNVTISARLDVNEYDYTINRNPGSSGSEDSETGGTVQYGSSITLETPNRDGYLFRGWKISAVSGNLNQNAYYTYSTSAAAPAMRIMMRNSNQSSNQDFIQEGGYLLTAGAEKIGGSVTLYNLSVDDGAEITIDEMWVLDHFEVTFKDFDGTVIGTTQEGRSVDAIVAPAIPNNTNEYYTYTFKYWKCNIDGNFYTTESLPQMGAFLPYESELGEAVYNGITFTAVYDLEYKKELHLVGSLGNDNLDMSDTENFPNGVLILGEGNANVPVITNFKIAKNDGIASLLLIPQYDASVFNIKAISINGQLVYGNGATSSTVLAGFDVTITGTETESDMLKILLDNLNLDASTSDDIFVQIIYEMKTAVGGRYEFGFITADYDAIRTDNITHGDRSEAYGIYKPNTSSETDAWKFNELRITVDSTAINVVVRVNGKIEIEDEQSFVYNGQQMIAADVTEQILNALQYTYNGFAQRESDTLTIKWYDAQGNELSGAPKNVGTYKIRISAAQTTYYFAADEVEATFTITPYEIFVVAGEQTVGYTGSNIEINNAASQGGIYIQDADGKYISVDAFVYSDLTLSGVELVRDYVNAGEYIDAIKCILTGDASNYTVTYVNGMLTITKAVNNWIGEITAPGGEYNGQKFDTVIFDAEFGKETAVVQYLHGYQTEANGGKTEIWKTEAPENAGSYVVKITIAETDNYSGLEAQVTLIITKKEIHISGLTFTAIDKMYNGEAQYWLVNPDGDEETDDAEVILKASDESLLQYIVFAGMKHPMDCINAGTYEILAVLQIYNSNYTFIETYIEKDENGQDVEKEREVDECTLPVDVNILKRKINVNMVDQKETYDGDEPYVEQGQDYVTITLEDGSAAPDYIIRDFFGGARDIYVTALEYSSTAVYYELVNGTYTQVYFTEEAFNANKELAGEEGYRDLYTKITIQPETLELFKDSGVNAGVYALHALLGENSNYEIVDESGSFIISKKTIELPTLGSVTYNGQEQSPTAPDTELYTIERIVRIDAGVYDVLVALKDPQNYQWEVDGAQETSEDQDVAWCIERKEITVILPDAKQEYTYGVVYGDIEWNDDIAWVNNDKPFDRDEIEIIFGLEMAEDYVIDAYSYNAKVLEVIGVGKDNYTVKYEGGALTVNKKAITQDELAEIIQSEIKDYTGNEISWAVGDFTINQSYINIIGIVSVGTTNYVNANGVYDSENDSFTYHTPTTKYSADVEIAVRNSNYKLADDIADNTVAIEVFIAKAQNGWEIAPSIDASELDQIVIIADPKFGEASDVVVTYFEDVDCTQPIDTSEMLAGVTYYAKLTVAETSNYFAFVEVITFNSDIVTVKIPVVYFENGTLVAGVTYEKPYLGTAYRFECEDHALQSSLYTYAFSGDAGLTNVGTYTITFTLSGENGQYEWENGTTDPVVFTLIITPVNLTIKPQDFTITYQDAAPAYALEATGLVNGEKLDDLLTSELYEKMVQFSCNYTQGSNVGVYDIFACNNSADVRAEIDNALQNYNVTFEKGALTVTALKFGYNDVESDDKTLEDLINNGPSFVYDNESKEVTVKNLPDELEVVIVYKDKDGNVLSEGEPKNAGEYTVEITLKVKDAEDADNYDLPGEVAEITLTIKKAEITITVYDKSYEYNETNRYDQFNADVLNGIEGLYEVTFDNVLMFNDGSVVKSIVLAQGEYINAGTYSDKITAEHTYSAQNYVVTIVEGDLIITKATNEWTKDLASADGIVYDKNAVEDGVDFSSQAKFGNNRIVYKFYMKQPNGGYAEISAPTHAGTYYVKATVEGTENYTGLTTDHVMLVINKQTIGIENVSFDNNAFCYNGEAHSIYADNYAELFNVSYTGNEKVNAGTYLVTATFAPKDTENYELAGADSKSATLTINKVQITITADDKQSMYGDSIVGLTYSITFVGAEGYDSFYESDWGNITLSTTATNQSSVGTYEILSTSISNTDNYDVTFHKGTYTITKYINNAITVEAEDVRYLMDLIYSAEALRGQNTIQFTFADSENGEYTGTLPKTVGTYYVKATIADTDNYNGVEAIASFKIEKATLSAITGIVYNKDTATWTAVVTTTDGKAIDCDVSYLVGDQSLISTEFKATSAGSFSVIAVSDDEENYNNSAAVTLATVYSVIFADTADNHEKQLTEADLSAAAFAPQYRFAGQAVTRPDAIPTVEGYTFREWMLDNNDYNFALGVNSDITLYAAWTINTYIINFYNEVVTGSKIENGIFVEGESSTVLFGSKTFTYGSTIVFIDGIPTKAEDDVYTYAFAYWADDLGSEIADTYVVTADDSFFAVYTRTAKEFTITYMVSIDGGQYEQYGATVTLPYGSPLNSLETVYWFIGDVWYTDEDRKQSAPSFVPAENMTLYGAYIFDIGAGDVNADGAIDVDDITLYRRWIVGGYNIVSVAPGTEWNLVRSGNFDLNTIYFVERVNDANRDDSGDIRDITTVRMALTGGYGYTYVSGLDSLARVSGEAVIIESQGLIQVDTTESFKSALKNGGIIQLVGDIDFTETVTISQDTVIYLNGYELDMSANSSRPFNMESNARLVIYGENATVKVGNYGLVNIPADADDVDVVLNGGSYVANTDNGSFIKPRGEGTISIEMYNIIFSDSSASNWIIDASTYQGSELSVKVIGGSYNAYAGFILGCAAPGEFLLENVIINTRYHALSAGGDDTAEPNKAPHITVQNCTITVTATAYSEDTACIVSAYGSQIVVNHSTLTSNVHIAVMGNGQENSSLTLVDCTINHNSDAYEAYHFMKPGKLVVNGEDLSPQAN